MRYNAPATLVAVSGLEGDAAVELRTGTGALRLRISPPAPDTDEHLERGVHP